MEKFELTVRQLTELVMNNHPELLGRMVEKYRKLLSDHICTQFNYTVQHRLFKGMRLYADSWWGKSDKAGMIFGLYEQEMLNALVDIPDHYDTFIDLGAADGYYGVGALVCKKFSRSICFEISEQGQSIIHKNAELNGVQNGIVVFGIAEKNFSDKIENFNSSRTVLFVDIEGAEFSLFDRVIFEKFRQSYIFVELHHFVLEDGDKKLEKLINDASLFFDVEIISTSARDLSALRELSGLADTQRWLLCSEGRPRLMSWLKLSPKGAML